MRVFILERNKFDIFLRTVQANAKKKKIRYMYKANVFPMIGKTALNVHLNQTQSNIKQLLKPFTKFCEWLLTSLAKTGVALKM